MVNCGICGNRTLRPERVKKEGVGWILVCQSCFEKLGKTKEHISPKSPETKTDRQPEQIERYKDGEVYDKVLKKCVPLPKKPASELRGALLEKDKPIGEQIRRQMRKMGYKPKKAKKVREQVHLPAPQVPAQPVIPVGPVTVEQRLDDVELRLIEVEKNMANVLGLLGQRETVKTLTKTRR